MLVPSNKQLRYMYFEYLLSDKIDNLIEMGADECLLDELFLYQQERENIELFAKYLHATTLKHRRDSILDVSDDPHLSLSRFLNESGIDVSFFGRDDHLKYMSSQFVGIKHYINGNLKNNNLVSSNDGKRQLIDNIFFPLQHDRLAGENTTILNYNFFNHSHFHTIIATGDSKVIPIIMSQNNYSTTAGFCGDINSTKTNERLKLYHGIIAYLNKRGSNRYYLSKDRDTEANKEYCVIKKK